MIDLHCHIIPWIDDGAKNAALACAMAEHALRSGVDTIVATPHCMYPNFCKRSYTYALAMLRALLQQQGIPLKLLPGAEVFAHPSHLAALLDEHQLVTLNHSRYLLVEFDFSASGRSISKLLDAIAARSFIPVIAHPERYAAVQAAPRLAAQWFHQGYLLQLNKGSLLGRLGTRAQQTGLLLLRHGFADVIASDAHDMKYRPSGFQSLLPVLHRLCPEEYVHLLLDGNPRRILADEPILREKEVLL